MSTIDLKPLSEEAIREMGYNGHDLWMVRIDSLVYGPYETESLKHYVQENEHLFEKAEASRSDEKEWKPFWKETKFQRRKLSAVTLEKHEGPFWIMEQGLKAGPFSFKEIDKKIEFGLLSLTDYISPDEGMTWRKIFEFGGFDRRSHAPEDLPIAPLEASFQKAKLAIAEKIETPHVNSLNVAAELTWEAHKEAKVIPFKIEEMTLKQTSPETEVSASLKWAIPAAMAFFLTIGSAGYYAFHSESSEEIAENETEWDRKGARKAPRSVIPGATRLPASANYGSPNMPQNNSRYPTYTETHEQHFDYEADRHPPIEPEQELSPQQEPQEPSLVGAENTSGSLDAAMNGVEQPVQQPMVEEASDF